VGELESEVIPQNGTERALADAAERIVAEVKRYEPALPASRFNMYELLWLYNFGFDRVGRANWDRWTTGFAIAVNPEGGIFAIRSGRKILYLATFWRTRNPNVNLAREIPKPDMNGNYAYIGWHWNDGGVRGALRMLRDHIIASCPGIEFICGHDNRPKVRKSRRGRLWVMEVAR
jgi:hypothetical protein